MVDQGTAIAMLQAYVAAFNNSDADALVALFDEDAIIEDPVGTPPKRYSEFAAWFQQGVAMQARLELVAPIRGSHGRAAAMAFKVHMITEDGPLTIHSLDVIELNEQGLIIRLDAYWGVDNVEAGVNDLLQDREGAQ